MALNKEQFQQIHDALLDGYNELALRQMVRFGMNEALDRIAGGSNLEERVFNLVEWADRTGRERELVQEAYNRNPTNPTLKKLYDAWFPPESPVKVPQVPDTASPQIFLSYSRKDSEQMQQVLRLLESAGLSAWTDEGLEPGTAHWQRTIQNAIQSTQCAVVLLSPDAEQSEWVSREVNYAQALGRRIFPVLLRGTQVESVPLSLFNAQYLDARQNLAEAVSRLLLPALTRYLNVVGTEPSDTVTGDSRVTPAPVNVVTSPEPKQIPPSTPARTKKDTPIAFDWVTIPAGEFLMGSDRIDKSFFEHLISGKNNETPQHRVYLPEYRIARVPVTNVQYKLFVDATGHSAPEHWENGRIPDGKENHPVVYITWRDAQVFCKWAGVQLPSEAEWEKAVRGTDGRIWPWGDEAPDENRCNFNNNVRDTTPVGKYPDGASPYGCLDMAGNVWEWTSSKYQNYPYDPNDGREDPEGDARRVLRGGSFIYDRQYVRCAFRDYWGPVNRLSPNGFRVLSPGL
jgi:formylglycine-generating enzyme required for sulfatase activity